MGSLEDGARQALEVCLGLKKGESFILVSDRPSLEVARAFEKEALEITKEVKVFFLEDFGERPLQVLPGEIEETVKGYDVSVFAAQKIGNELETVRMPLKKLGVKYGRHANLPGITRKVMETGLSTDHRKVWAFSDRVYDLVSKAREIRVESPGGTDLKVRFSPKFKWVNSKGDLREKGHFGTNLPGAEVFTYPDSVEGVAVIDLELGDVFTERFGFLRGNPVRVEIEQGRAVRVECKNKEIERALVDKLDSDPNGRRIGEFGIGTNPFIKELVGVFLQDEKFPGVHIAFGNPYPGMTGAGFDSKIHVDGLIGKATVKVDGRGIMEKGRFTLSG